MTPFEKIERELKLQNGAILRTIPGGYRIEHGSHAAEFEALEEAENYGRSLPKPPAPSAPRKRKLRMTPKAINRRRRRAHWHARIKRRGLA